jgi:hypothetical protein
MLDEAGGYLLVCHSVETFQSEDQAAEALGAFKTRMECSVDAALGAPISFPELGDEARFWSIRVAWGSTGVWAYQDFAVVRVGRYISSFHTFGLGERVDSTLLEQLVTRASELMEQAR